MDSEWRLHQFYITEAESLWLSTLSLLAIPGQCVELGSGGGASTRAIASTRRWVYTYDICWQWWTSKTDDVQKRRFCELFWEYVGEWSRFVKPMPYMSWEPQAENAAVAFLFIDANHSTQAVGKDIRAWQDRVPNGGIVAFHDCNYLKWQLYPGQSPLMAKPVQRPAVQIGAPTTPQVAVDEWFAEVEKATPGRWAELQQVHSIRSFVRNP